MHRLALVICFAFVTIWTVGCSSGPTPPPPPTAVKGKVNLNGKAMEKGEIRFNVPGFAAKVMEIQNGEFKGEAPIGKNQVEVVLMKDNGFTTTEPKTPIQINMVAAKFSGPATVLSADVTKGGANEFTFDVTSK